MMWNIKGLSTKRKKDDLKSLIAEKKVEIVGIMEPKLKSMGIVSLKSSLGDGWEIVDNLDELIAGDRATIIIVFKKSHWSFQVIFKHKKIIHACLTSVGGYIFDLSVVYGERNPPDKKELWSKLEEATIIS